MRMRFVFNSSSIRVPKAPPAALSRLQLAPLPVAGETTSSDPMSRRLINMLSSCSPTDHGAVKPETLITTELGKKPKHSSIHIIYAKSRCLCYAYAMKFTKSIFYN